MNIKKIIIRTLLVTTFVIFGTAVWYDMYVRAPKLDAAFDAKSDAEKYNAKILCLDGVAYWELGIYNSRRLAPKYSPGKSTPDICENL